MNINRTRVFWKHLTALLLITLLALLGACGNGGDDAANVVPTNEDADVAEDAPDPISVTASDLTVIDQWREAGVPHFGDGEVLDFDPHASQIENGGTLLLDGNNAPSSEIIAFYRGALSVLGWQELTVGNDELTAESNRASLLVKVSDQEDHTTIMMILTDRVSPGQSGN